MRRSWIFGIVKPVRSRVLSVVERELCSTDTDQFHNFTIALY